MSRGIAASCVIASVSIGCGARSPLPDDELAAAAFFDASVYADSARPSADAATACKPARGDAGACTRLTPEENTISVVCDSSPAPVPTGGVIANGTYVLLASRFHGACPPAEDDRITWNICGATWSTVQEITRFGAVTTQHIDGNVVASGASVTFTASCPASGIPVTTLGFDAAESTLALYVYGYGPGTVRVDSFVRK